MPRVTVHVVFPDSLTALPPDAEARISVQDVSRADASAVDLASTVVHGLRLGAPVVAEIDVGEVDPQARLSVRVHVTRADRAPGDVEVGDLVSTQSHPVLTRGFGDSVVVPLRVVGA